MKKYNTDLVDSIKFRAHGSIECEILEEGILIYTAYGPFNKELIEALISLEDIAFSDIELAWEHWAEIVIFKHSCMILEEAADQYKQFLLKMKNQGEAPNVSGYVYDPDIEGTVLYSEIWKNINRDAGIPYREFTHTDDALAWVRSELNNFKSKPQAK